MIPPPSDEEFTPRRPDGGWDGWFAIGIFPENSQVRWCKLHVFVSSARPGRKPLALIEGMEHGELMALVGLADRTVVERAPLAESTVRYSGERLGLSAADRLDWRGGWPHFQLEHTTGRVGARLHVAAHDPVRWIGAGRALSYFGVHGTLGGEVLLDGAALPLAGLGVVEHAWGASVPVDARAFVRGFWQWDVLAFHDPPHAAVAALAVAPLGRHAIPLTGHGRTPGGELAQRRGLRVRHLEAKDGLPTRWDGLVEGGGERIEYHARAVGEPARVLDHGAFFGFAFEGRVTRGTSTRAVSGTGYSEFADPGGVLPSRVKTTASGSS